MSDYTYRLRASDSKLSFTPPQYAFLTTGAQPQVSSGQCIIHFDVPADLQPPVFMYYKLTNFFQNHRRYVASMDTDQLKGKNVSPSTLNNGHCKPLALPPHTSMYLGSSDCLSRTVSTFFAQMPRARAEGGMSCSRFSRSVAFQASR